MQAADAMTLDDWLCRIEACHPSAIELGLDRVRQVADRLALDFSSTRILTIAGTNGKGSTQTFLDGMLRAGGYRTGCYSSPHFLRYNERVRLDGSEATDAVLCQAFAEVETVRGDIPLTYFEFGTLAALKIFADARLDVLLLEVGLGGRLDAVNIVDADVAIVTTVALDHTDWLGDSREAIGREKAGIFRQGRPAVCGDPEPPHSVAAVAEETGASLYQVGVDFHWRATGDGWCWQGRDRNGEAVVLDALPLTQLPLPNAATALQALYLLPATPPRGAIDQALSSASMTGRMQRIGFGGAECILDVAHNPEAAGYVAQRLMSEPVPGRTHLLLGMLGDKDVDGVLAALQPLADSWHLVSLGGPRGQGSETLARALRRIDSEVNLHCYPDVSSALEQLRTRVGAGDRVLIAGSFFTVSAALEQLQLKG